MNKNVSLSLMLPIVVLMVHSCKTTRRNSSQDSKLNYEQKNFTEADLLSAYATPSEFVKFARAQLNVAEVSMQEAAIAMRQSQREEQVGMQPATQQEFPAGCVINSTNNQKECVTLRRVSPEAYKKLRKAYVFYSRLLNYFDIPIINRNLRAEHSLYYRNMVQTDTALVAGTFDVITKFDELPDARDDEGRTIMLDLGTDSRGNRLTEPQKEEWWDKTINDNCAGTMSGVTHNLCLDALLGATLQETAYRKLQAYLDGGSRNEAFLDEYVKYFEMSQHRLNMLTTIYQEATRGLMALENGMISSQDITSIPTLAVVGEPDAFVPKVTEYIDKLKKALEDFSSAKERGISFEIEGIRTADEAKRLLNDLNEIESKSQISVVDGDYLTNETKFLLDKIEKLRSQLEASSGKFVVDFDHVFGAYSSDIIKIGNVRVMNLSHPSKGDGSFAIPAGTKAISVTSFGGKDIVANGVYGAGRLPIPSQFSLLKKVSKKVSKSVSKVGKQVSGGIESLKDAGGKAWERNRGALISPVMGMFGLPALPKLDGDMGPGKILELSANIAGSLLKPFADVGFAALDGVLPPSKSSPLDAVNSLIGDLNKMPYPPMENHVYNQATTLDGYVVATSVGKSLGYNKGESTGRTAGMSGGISFDVKPFGLGVGSNAGMSIGTSTGTSTGASAGTTRGQSMNVGFFGPAEIPALRVGMLLARFACPGGRTAYAPVGTGNVIVLDAQLKDCTSVTFFINDDLEGSKKNVCGASRQDPCGKGTYTLEVSTYADSKDLFNKLMGILQSTDFQAVVSSSVVSSDPIGSAWRVFENMANGQGLEPGKMRPVIEQFVTYARDEYLLKQAVLELQKLEGETQKISITVRQHARTKEYLQSLQNSNANVTELRAAMLGLINSRIDVSGYYIRHYAARVRFWLEIYRASMDYHQPQVNRSNLDTFYNVVLGMLNELDANTADFASINANEAKIFAASAAPGVSSSSIFKMLENIRTELDQKTFMDGLDRNEQLGHCVVDIADVGYGADGLAAAKARAMGAAGGRATRESINYIKFGNNLSPDMKRVRDEIVSIYNQATLEGAYEIEIRTDPARLNDSTENLTTRPPLTGDFKFREPVAYCSHPDAGTAKVIGVAVTYAPPANVLVGQPIMVPRQNTIATHDALMTAQSASGVRFHRFLDRAWTPTFAGSSLTSTTNALQTYTTLVNIKSQSDIQAACRTPTKASDYATSDCIRRVLGESIDKRTIASSGIARSFFNSYVGGTWRIYLPDHPDWKNFNGNSGRTFFHMFLKRTTSVAP